MLASPVVAPVRVVDPPTAQPRSGTEPALRAVTSITIGADEPVFAGHYPDFAIFPGVCVIECVHRSALATVPTVHSGGRVELAALESARFVGPVYPGDTCQITLDWRPAGADWVCAGRVVGPAGDAAQIRLRYRVAATAVPR